MNRFIASTERKILVITDSFDEFIHRKFLIFDDTNIVEYRRDRYQIQQCKSDSLVSLEICLQEIPDCVLLDWELPNLDREQLLHNLISKQIPVVILVSASNEESVSYIELYYQDYLVKETLTKELIFSALRNVTDRKLAEIKLQQYSDRQKLLSSISQRIRASLNLEEILSTTVAEIHHVLQSDRVLVYQIYANSTGAVIAESVSTGFISVLDNIYPEETFPAEVYDSYLNGKVYSLENIETGSVLPCLVEFLQGLQVKAKLVIPIIQDQLLWGLLITHQCDRPRAWQDSEIELLQQLCNQIAIAIQQASLYQRVQVELTNKESLYLQLANELDQKKVLLKEVHHRVKNNLQVMSSLLRMQFRKTTPELKFLIEDYQNRIQSMALIHAQLHNNEELANINFRDYISDLMANLFQCYVNHSGSIEYKLDVINIFLPLEQSISVGLIINELISNTLKYAFPDGSGEINIKLT